MTQTHSFQIRGRSIVAGEAPKDPGGPLLPADRKFYAVDPRTGQNLNPVYLAASQEDIESACWAAWQAFHALADRPAADRAILLETIAARIGDLGEELLAVATDETGLGISRLITERERMVGTLHMFAAAIRSGDWLEAVIDPGQPSRRPSPKPDIRRMLRPLGPVGVFGAGNFPLAYSTAGGDTASALAAGCPVVVKGHPGHPGTGELVAQAIAAAVKTCNMHPGTFSFLHSGGQREMDIGERLTLHPAIRAIGFTGGLPGGMALERLARERPDPIPVFAEMGSTNPVFILQGVMAGQAELVVERVVGSLTSSGGQQCTAPGLVFVPRGAAAEVLLNVMSKAVEGVAATAMLNPRTHRNFVWRAVEVGNAPGVELLAGVCPGSEEESDRRNGGGDGGDGAGGGGARIGPALFKTSFDTYRKNADLRDEIFGPAAIVVLCENEQQLLEAAASVQGSLTATIWAGADDARIARQLHQVLEQRIGRLIYNGVPTGVEVCHAMVHGGPYPATNQQHTTAVGPFAMKRWARPVCFQNTPDAFLAPELRNANPLGIRRLVNGEWTTAPIGRG